MKEITITLEEYKELLMIKGKYEELKDCVKPVPSTRISYINKGDNNGNR